MLKNYHKAILKDAFPTDEHCPVSLKTIESCLQILSPAFHSSLIMQKNKSTIADVLSVLFIMISRWSRMQINGIFRKLTD